jgi:hypothetical protein
MRDFEMRSTLPSPVARRTSLAFNTLRTTVFPAHLQKN